MEPDKLDQLLLDAQVPKNGNRTGRPKGQTVVQTEEIRSYALEVFESGITDNKEAWATVKTMFPTAGLGLIKEAKQIWRNRAITNLDMHKQDFYIKETLLEHDRILENAKTIEDKTMASGKFMVSLEAQKNIMESLKQRNSLLGIDKSNPTVEINFQSNVDDVSFLNVKMGNE